MGSTRSAETLVLCDFCVDDPQHFGWALDRETYTIESVARKAREFFFDELSAICSLATPARATIGNFLTARLASVFCPEAVPSKQCHACSHLFRGLSRP
jgi:hypothetical protein